MSQLKKFMAPATLFAVILTMEMFAGHTNVARNTSATILITLAFVAFRSSFAVTLGCSFLSWIYTAFFLSRHLPNMDPEQLKIRAVLWFILMIGFPILIRYLRAKSEQDLLRQIGERRQAEAHLRSSEERSRAVIESALDAFVAMDSSGVILNWNRQAELLFGWQRDEVMGQDLGSVVIPQRLREAHRRGLKRYMETGHGPVLNQRIEVMAQHRSGKEIPVELTIYPIAQADGVIFGSFIHDIAQEKRRKQIHAMQLEVTRVLTRSSSIQEAAPKFLTNLIQGLDCQRGQLWLEDTVAGLASFQLVMETMPSPSEGQTRPAHEAADAGDERWEILRSVKGRMLQGAEMQIFTRHLTARDAHAVGSVQIFPLISSGHDVVGAMVFYCAHVPERDESILSFMSDIGTSLALFVRQRQGQERLELLHRQLEKKVEERTRELAVALEQASRANQLKDEFLATVSHELRTPMGVILGHSELLLDGDMNIKDVRRSVETIRRNAKVQTQIISDLLDVSRIITGKMDLKIETLDINALVHAALSSVELAASAKDIEVFVDLSLEPLYVRGDSTRLQQIFWNILSNATKFTPKGGKIWICVGQESSRATVSVRDSGKGIDPSFLPHVFERFRQEDSSTTRVFGGLGLGLAIVRHLVEALGGTVEVSSEGVGKGAQFTVAIPLTGLQGRVAKSISVPIRAEHEFGSVEKMHKVLKAKRILVVEDEPDTREMIRMVLERQGAVVFGVPAVREALKLFDSSQPDLVVSDISMPGEDGLDFIRLIRSSSNDRVARLPTIAFTAQARAEDVRSLLSAGFDLHIPKPIDGSDLVEQIAAFLDSALLT